MGLRLLWQPAIAVIVTHDNCVVVFWQINSLSLSHEWRRLYEEKAATKEAPKTCKAKGYKRSNNEQLAEQNRPKEKRHKKTA